MDVATAVPRAGSCTESSHRCHLRRTSSLKANRRQTRATRHRARARALADSCASQCGRARRTCHENRRRRVRPWISSADVTPRASRMETTRGAVSGATATKLYVPEHCCGSRRGAHRVFRHPRMYKRRKQEGSTTDRTPQLSQPELIFARLRSHADFGLLPVDTEGVV